MRILTWHVHGSYLAALVQQPQHTFYLPVKPGRPHGFGGRCGPFRWPDNVQEIPAEDVVHAPVDLLLFQSAENYLEDQGALLTAAQRRLPRIYLEHDPPRRAPTDTPHIVDDPNVLLVHVTHFNDLMWDSGRAPTRVIEHGVDVPDNVRATYALERGIVVVNNLRTRGRRLGADLFTRARSQVALDLAGMGSEIFGGLGDLSLRHLWDVEKSYRFFFHPARYTSLGLAACEAMMIGLPIVSLATTEMVTVIESGVSGYIDTDMDALIVHMRRLAADPEEAAVLGAAAREVARARFGLGRFLEDWDEAFRFVAGLPASRQEAARERAHGTARMGTSGA